MKTREKKNHDPTELIDRERQPISNKDKTIQRRNEYFEDLNIIPGNKLHQVTGGKLALSLHGKKMA